MPSLDNYSTTDSYSQLGELTFDPVEQVTVIVANGAIMAQFAYQGRSNVQLQKGAISYDPTDRRMLPGVWGWNSKDFRGQNIVGIRVRSAVAGSPAVVTIHA